LQYDVKNLVSAAGWMLVRLGFSGLLTFYCDTFVSSFTAPLL